MNYMVINENITKIIQDTTLQKYQKLSSILHEIFVNICSIDQKKYYILGSFAIRKNRQISDLDINLDSNEFFKLNKALKLGFGKLEIYNNQIRWFYDLTETYNSITKLKEDDFSLEAFQKEPLDGYPNSEYSLDYLQKNNMLDIDENGHQYFSLLTLLKWKKQMNRPKDQPDIELIEQLLKKNTETKRPSKRSSKRSAKRSSKKPSKRSSKKPSKKPSKKTSKKPSKKSSKKTSKKS